MFHLWRNGIFWQRSVLWRSFCPALAGDEPPSAAGSGERGVRPVPSPQLRAGLLQPSRYGRRSDAGSAAQGLSRSRTLLRDGGRSQAKLSPGLSPALDRAPWHGSQCHPGTVRTATCPLGGDVTKGEMSLLPIRWFTAPAPCWARERERWEDPEPAFPFLQSLQHCQKGKGTIWLALVYCTPCQFELINHIYPSILITPCLATCLALSCWPAPLPSPSLFFFPPSF